MRLQGTNFSIAEIRDMLQRNDLIVNKDYQRGSRLWPSGPRTYFIDTILEGFPFPKLYFFEYLEKSSRKTKREIVDGQQRVSSIIDFLSDRFRLTSVSRNYAGANFSELSEEDQLRFLSYSVPVDVILNAERAQILEMFRRMNSYTLPLNEAEKRHSTFQGEFKWFVNKITDQYYAFFSEFGVFSNRQIVRMADAELVVEILLSLEKGIISSSNGILSDMYRRYDPEFPLSGDYRAKIDECFGFIMDNLGAFRGKHLMKPYAVHSLCCALLHNKYGLPDTVEKILLPPIGVFVRDLDVARRSLEALSLAHEGKEEEGDFAEYVWGCLAGTNREPRRLARVRSLTLALRGELMRE
jgi:hypothetical protein